MKRTATLAIFGLLLLFLSAPVGAYTEEVVGEVQALDRNGNITVNGVTAEITEATRMFTHLREPLRMSELAVGVPVDMVVRGSAVGTEAISIIATVAR